MTSLKKILFWILLLIVFYSIQSNLDAILSFVNLALPFDFIEGTKKFFATTCWFLVFLILAKLKNSIFWDTIIAKKLTYSVPAIWKFITSIILAMIIAAIVMSSIFGKSLTGILALGGGLGIVLGFALRTAILDLYSGIVIQIEKPFRIGDFIMLNNTRLAEEPLIGKVVSIDWRTSRLAKTDGNMVIVPNNLFTKLVLTNFMLPGSRSRMELNFCIGFEVDSKDAMKVILNAAYSVPGIVQEPRPKVKIQEITLNGAIYQVRYWVIPTQISPGRSKDYINRAVMSHLKFAGMQLANEKRNVYNSSIPDRTTRMKKKKRSLITRVPLFRSLSEDDIQFLSDHLVTKHIGKGKTVVEQGEEDNTMYLISEGTANIMVHTDEKDNDKKVNTIGPGQFFGEMSLVLGEPRNATVVAHTDCRLYKVNKETMQNLFDRDPNLMNNIVEVISERKKMIDATLNPTIATPAKKAETNSRFIRDRILKFFKRR